MKFTQLPKDGASWQEPLRYKFSTESTEPENLKVEIRDETLQQTIATLNLYATTTGDIDIAPYLRDRLRLTPITSIRAILLAISPSAIAVSVVVNGVRSAVRHFFRSAHDYNHIGMLSYHAATRSVRRGDAIRLTLFAKANIMVTINYNSVVPTTPTQHSLLTKGMPAEIVIPTEQLRSTNSLEITILYDGTKTETVTYMIEAANSASRCLVWYNPMGGIESYTFGHSLRLGYSISAEEIAGVGTEMLRCVEGKQRYRLCTGYDTAKEIARVVELLLSPMVLSEQSGTCTPIEIENREVIFDSKGMLHSFALDISEQWKGGKL